MAAPQEDPGPAADPAPGTDAAKRYAHLTGSLVVYDSKAQRFVWTDSGRSAYAALRRCAYLQHAVNLDLRPGVVHADALGTARCRALQSALADACKALLEATWKELQQMAWRELRDYVLVMRPFDSDTPQPGGDAAEAALVHIWARFHAWMALHRAPADLLGDLNEVFALKLAEDAGTKRVSAAGAGRAAGPPPAPASTLEELRATVAMLLEAWQEGLAQIGDLLAVSSWPEDGLTNEQCIPWLLNWRLYLIIHRHMAVWTNTYHVACWVQHQRSEPIYPYVPQLQDHLVRWGWSPQAPLAPAPDKARQMAAEAAPPGRAQGGSAEAPRQSVDASGPGTAGAAAAAADAACEDEEEGDSGLESHVKVGMHSSTQPRTLLTFFMAMCAEKAMSLVLPFLTDATAEGLFESLNTGWTADPGVLQVNAQLRKLCPDMVLLLHDALDEDGPEDALKKHTQQVSLGGSPPKDPAGKPPSLRAAQAAPHGSDAPAASSAAPDPSAATSAPGGAADARGAAGTAAEGGCTHMLDLLEALVPVLPPRRVSRLCNNPGQLALQYHIMIAARSAPEKLVGPDGVHTSTEEVPMKNTLGAALVYGICFYLHQTHSLLVAIWCMSNVSAPLEQPQLERALRSQDAARDRHTAPVIVVTQMPVDATSLRIEVVTAAAGAAALAAGGAVGTAANAAAHAAALACVRHPAGSSAAAAAGGLAGGGHGGQGPAQGGAGGGGVEDAPQALQALRAAEWARYVEARVGELLAGGASATAGNPASSGPGSGSSSSSGGADAPFGALQLDRNAVLHFALFLSAGRVRLLAANLEAHSQTDGVYRWCSGERAGSVPWQLQLPPPVPTQPSGAAPTHNACTDGDAPPASSASALSDAYLASSFFRFSVLQLAVTSCATAANRLAHVPNTHTPGSGASLKALCVAHSDAVTLGLAAEMLLAVAQALSLQLWGPSLPAGAEQQHASRLAAAMDGRAAAGRSGGGGASSGGSGAEGATGAGAPPGAADGGAKGSHGPRLPRKVSWRRSLRRILPVMVGGAAGPVGSLMEPAPGPAPAGRGCWAGDAVDPAAAAAPLPSPAPLSSIPRLPLQGPTYMSTEEAHAEAMPARKRAALKQHSGGGAAGGGAKGAGGAQPAAVTRETPDGHVVIQEGGPAGGGRRGPLPLPPAALELLPAVNVGNHEAGMASTVVTPVPLSAAETGLLCMLHALCEQLHATAARAADLLVMEMTHRVARIYRGDPGGADAPRAKSVSAAAGAPAPTGAEAVVKHLLEPLRAAVDGLHPFTQAQLLTINLSAALAVLQQQHGAGGGGGAPGGASGGVGGAFGSIGSFGRAKASRTGSKLVRPTLQQDLDVLSDELQRIRKQVKGVMPEGQGAGPMGALEGRVSAAAVQQEYEAACSGLVAKIEQFRYEAARR